MEVFLLPIILLFGVVLAALLILSIHHKLRGPAVFAIAGLIGLGVLTAKVFADLPGSR